MAAPSPAIAPAAAPPRPTVVLRAGPPPRSGRLDRVLGAIGVLLLLSTVGLAVALPHKDVLPQQFKVAFVDETHDLTAQSFAFRGTPTEQTHDFLYDVPDDNAYLLTVKYEFIDDVPSSLPDRFSLRLYDPQGNRVGPDVLADSIPAVPADNSTIDLEVANVTTAYRAVRMVAQFSVLLPKPADDIVEVQDQSLTAAELGEQLAAKAHLDTHGTWKLRVTLIQAGDCPEASGGAEALNRRAACQQELQDAGAAPQDVAQGTDAGNLFTVGVFSYSRFVPDIQKIG